MMESQLESLFPNFANFTLVGFLIFIMTYAIHNNRNSIKILRGDLNMSFLGINLE